MLLPFSFILTMNLICMYGKCKKVLAHSSNYIYQYHIIFLHENPNSMISGINNFWSGFTYLTASSTSDY